MCTAVYVPPNKRLTLEQMTNMYEQNPDGCGLAFINHKNRIVVYKTLDFKKFVEAYDRVADALPKSPKLVHFRVKTHGVVATENCHPFRIDKDHVFVHNGTIRPVAPTEINGDKSDTRIFNEEVLRHLPANWMKNHGVTKMIEHFIGFSKLVAMDVDGNVKIYNESKGEWHEGIWFSNDRYKPKKKDGTSTGNTSRNYSQRTTGNGTKPWHDEPRFQRSKTCDKYGAVYYDDLDKINKRWNKDERWTEAFDKRVSKWKRWSHATQTFMSTPADDKRETSTALTVITGGRRSEKSTQGKLRILECATCRVSFAESLNRVRLYRNTSTARTEYCCDYCASRLNDMGMYLFPVQDDNMEGGTVQ